MDFDSADDLSDSEVRTPPRSTGKSKSRNKSKGTTKKADVKQKFRDEWLRDKDLKDWLAPVKNDKYKAQCKVCKTEFISELFNIRRHGTRKAHYDNMNVLNKQGKIDEFAKSKNEDEKVKSLDTKVKSAELKIAAFGAEHSMSFSTAGKLPELLKEIFDDADARYIATHISSERKKRRE